MENSLIDNVLQLIRPKHIEKPILPLVVNIPEINDLKKNLRRLDKNYQRPDFRLEAPDRYSYMFLGLHAFVQPLHKDVIFPGEFPLEVAKGSLIGHIDFMPFEGQIEYRPDRLTPTLAAGYVALHDFVNTIEHYISPKGEKLKSPLYLYSKTNQQMAGFSVRFGFRKLSPNDEQTYISAKYEDVKSKIDELSKTPFPASLAKRLEKVWEATRKPL